jgi:hypothetical protein
MKKASIWLMVATLFCGLFTLTSCVDEADNPTGDSEIIQDREEILSHIKNDAKVLAEEMNPEMLNLTNEVYSQLMALMAKDRNYMRNMKQILAMMAANNALTKIMPVTKGSELAKMGYLMYIPVDIQTFGVQVVFDENGSSRLFPCEGMEFIFPATVNGLSTTLYKVAFKAGNKWKETVAPAQLKNLKGVACVYRVPETITITLSGLFDNKVQTLNKSTFDIGETLISGRSSTSLKGTGYGLPDVESTLDFKFSTAQKGKVQIDCNYVNNGLQIMTLQAMLTLPETGNLIERLSTNDFNGSHIDFDMQILNDLNLYGSIRDVAQFSEAFMNITQNKSISSTDFSNNVDKINQYSEIHATCQNVTNPLYLQLMAKWVDNKNLLMPGIWSYENLELIPFDTYVEQADMDNINKVLEVVIPPMGSNTLLGVQVFSRMMQMLPLNSAEWNI